MLDVIGLFWVFVIFIVMLIAAGIYGILVTRNLIRVLIGMEILTKAVTLLFVIVGYITRQEALAQSFVITMIVIEVVVIVVAGGVILGVYKNDESIDVENVKRLKG